MNSRPELRFKSALQTREGRAYYGQLTAEAERALLPEGSPSASLALAWLFAHSVTQGGESHTFSLQRAAIEGEEIGDWKVHFELSLAPDQPIDLYRLDYLARDGAASIELALPLIAVGHHRDLFAFCVLQLALHCISKEVDHFTLEMRDSRGVHARVLIQREKAETTPPFSLTSSMNLLHLPFRRLIRSA